MNTNLPDVTFLEKSREHMPDIPFFDRSTVERREHRKKERPTLS
jgi:hypothetical protein